MKEERYGELLHKLESYIDVDGVDPSVSPTQISPWGRLPWEKLLELYINCNISVVEIAKMFNCNRRTVHRHLKKQGLTKGRKKSLRGRTKSEEHKKKIKIACKKKSHLFREQTIKRMRNSEINNFDTDIERMIENQLLFRNILYVKQFPYKLGIADFWLPEYNAIIEADGGYWHSSMKRKIRDKIKTTYLENNGYIVHRFNDKEIKGDAEKCVSVVIGDIYE